MGTYFNPDNASFERSVKSQIYVDKTGLLAELNKLIGMERCCLAVSHARRFGKSQAAAMIDAYYSMGSDSKELFSRFAISKDPEFEKHLNCYNVLHIDVATFTDDFKENLVEKIWEHIYREMKKNYPEIPDVFDSKADTLMEVYRLSGRQFVIILDEWDCVIRNQADRPDLVHRYMQFLHSIFKSEESKSFLALGYITGILPVKKIRDESALNNFLEFTMLNSEMLTPYFGFTEKEVQDLCESYGMDFESMKAWYDGYIINGQHMYNPNSVYNACFFSGYRSYWKDTSSFETINDFINMNFEGLKDAIVKMIEGGQAPVDTEGFKNDLSIIGSKDDALTALIHLGYLGYDERCKKAYIPNYEVKLAYMSAMKTGKSWGRITDSVKKCEELLWATIDGEADEVAEYIELAHEAYTSIIKYNSENSLSCVITMAYFTAPAYYNVIRELPSGKGFADIAFIPRKDYRDKPAMVIELKWQEDADTAIRQIKEKRYEGALSGWEDEVLLVGISYGKDKKHHCIIEKSEIKTDSRKW